MVRETLNYPIDYTGGQPVNRFAEVNRIEEKQIELQSEALTAGLAAVRRSMLLLDSDRVTDDQRTRLLCALIEASAQLARPGEQDDSCSFPVAYG